MPVKRSSSRRDRYRVAIRKTNAACHICGEPIDYTLPATEPRSFVIDHVVPLAKGGADVLTNVRAAHKDCNNKKRARLVAPIVRRSGSLG